MYHCLQTDSPAAAVDNMKYLSTKTYCDKGMPSRSLSVESGYCSSVCSISSNYSTVESFNNSETVTLATSDTKSGYRSISPSVCSISSNYSTVESFNNETETLSTSDMATDKPTTVIQIHVSPAVIPSDYKNYVNTFFDLFVDGLSLREDIVYQLFNIDKVDAIAFGVKCDRVVPCIRVFTQFNGEKSELIYDVARQLSTAVLNQKNVLLSVEDCTHYIEVGDYEDSKIYPEELMGYPGEQFSVHGGTGTIGYYLRADLQLNIGGTTKSIAQHFAITCSHCVFPNRIIDTLRTAARTNPSVHQKIQDYPFAQLYEHMWEHSSHRKHHYGFACTSHLLPQGHPGAYSGFPYENELLMIKGAISCSEVRDIVNENVIYEDHHNSHLPHRKYTYVTSKYGMIPKHFSMPLPNYIFNHYGNIYHIPFSVDVAALKVEDAGLDDKHCLENIIESTVDGSYNELRCCNIFGSTYRQQICPHYGLLKLPESQKDLPLAVENVSIQQQISPLEESLPSQFLITTTPKKKGSAFDQMYRLGKTAVANGRNMFGLREQTKLQLQVMSNQHDGRNLIRTLDIGNDDFCLEFVHRNQTNRQQKRCFPTVKWKKKSTEFIKRGDSGSSLFIVTKDENNIDKPVLLGVVGSANTATRVDFVKDVLSHDLLTYMTSELKKCLKQMEDEPFNLLCDTIERRVQFKSELSELNSSPQTERKNICSRIQEKHRFVKSLETSVGLPINDTQWGSVSFRLRECIRDCKI